MNSTSDAPLMNSTSNSLLPIDSASNSLLPIDSASDALLSTPSTLPPVDLDSEEEVVCASCFVPTDSRLQPCGHPLCEPCTDRWLNVNPTATCPTCRTSILVPYSELDETTCFRTILLGVGGQSGRRVEGRTRVVRTGNVSGRGEGGAREAGGVREGGGRGMAGGRNERRGVRTNGTEGMRTSGRLNEDQVIENVVESPSPPRVHAGITLTNAPAGIRGVRVWRVLRRDMAYKCGVRAGDIITHMNRRRVSTHQEAIAIINRATEDRASVECAIVRDWCLC